MRKELEQKLVERWPEWFNIGADPRQNRMADGFCCGDGWFGILSRLCEELEPLVTEAEKQTGHPFEVLQVKEKLGRMAFWAWLADALGLKFTRNWLLMCIGCKAAEKFEENETLSSLERLARLKASGVLSETEFQTMKAEVLRNPDEVRRSPNRR
jgi:hypothetical protein